MKLQQNEATAALRRIYFYAVDATDGFSPETGLSSFTVDVSENGAARAAGAGSDPTEIDATNMPGLYYYEATVGELSTLGALLISIKHASMRDFLALVQVIAYDPYSATELGLTNLNATISSRAPAAEYDTELDVVLSSRAPANEYDSQLDQNLSTTESNIRGGTETLESIVTDIGNLNNIAAADVWAVVTRTLSGTIGDFDALDAALDAAHGAASWLTGGGGSGIVIQVIPAIPKNIDLADTKTVRIALYVIDASDDLPTTGELTAGTIKIERSADGGTSWSTIRDDVACSKHAGGIYYDEVFSSGNGYASADMIKITFKSQKATISANDFEIADATDGVVFITRMDSGLSGGGPSAGDIADAVWDEPIADHTTSSQFGGKNQKVVPSETINDYKATVAGLATEANATTNKNTIVTEVDANETKIDALPATGEYDSELTAIQADLDNPNQYKADVSALATEANVDANETKIDLLQADISRIIGLAFQNAAWEFTFTGDDQTSGGIWLYDSKANATTHNKSTGLIGYYSMTCTFAAGKPTVMKLYKES